MDLEFGEARSEVVLPNELVLGAVGRRPLVVDRGGVVRQRGPERDSRALGGLAHGLADGEDASVRVIIVVAVDVEARGVEGVAIGRLQVILDAEVAARVVEDPVAVGRRPGAVLADNAGESARGLADSQGEVRDGHVVLWLTGERAGGRRHRAHAALGDPFVA